MVGDKSMDNWRTTREVLAITQCNLEQALESLTKPPAEVLQLTLPDKCAEYIELFGTDDDTRKDANNIKSTIVALIETVKNIQKEALLFSADPILTKENISYPTSAINAALEDCVILRTTYTIAINFIEYFKATFGHLSNYSQVGDLLLKEKIINKSNISKDSFDSYGDSYLYLDFTTEDETLKFIERFNKYVTNVRIDKTLLLPTPTQIVTYWEGIIEKDSIKDSSGNIINLENQFVLVSLGYTHWKISIPIIEGEKPRNKDSWWKQFYLRKEVAHNFMKKYKNVLKRK